MGKVKVVYFCPMCDRELVYVDGIENEEDGTGYHDITDTYGCDICDYEISIKQTWTEEVEPEEGDREQLLRDELSSLNDAIQHLRRSKNVKLYEEAVANRDRIVEELEDMI